MHVKTVAVLNDVDRLDILHYTNGESFSVSKLRGFMTNREAFCSSECQICLIKAKGAVYTHVLIVNFEAMWTLPVERSCFYALMDLGQFRLSKRRGRRRVSCGIRSGDCSYRHPLFSFFQSTLSIKLYHHLYLPNALAALDRL